MGLSCECYADGYWEFYSSSRPKARKQHVCAECAATIHPGEVYYFAAGKWDGDFCTYKCCERCDDLASSLQALGYCFDWGGLWAAHREYAAMITEQKARRLAKRVAA